MNEQRRSKVVPATLTALIAATLAGCSGSGYSRCEDGRGVTLSDVYCGANPPPLPSGDVAPAHWVRHSSSSSNHYGSSGGFWGRSGSSGSSGSSSAGHSSGSVSRGGFGGFGGFGG